MKRPNLRATDQTDALGPVFLGLGLTWEEAADQLGVSRNTLYNRSAKNPTQFEAIRSKVAAAVATRDAKTLSQATGKTADMVATAHDRISGIFDKSFRLTERLIQKAEAEGDDVSLDRLMEIHKNITVWSSKFIVSEAPKRLQMEGNVEHSHRMVSDDTIQRLTTFMAKHQALLTAPADAIEAEVVR